MTETRRRWTAIRNMSRYWFHRIIEGKGWCEARAGTDQVEVEEARATQRINKWRTYQRFKAQGLIGAEIYARMYGTTPERTKAKWRRLEQARRNRWGGSPHFGTASFNRWLLGKSGL